MRKPFLDRVALASGLTLTTLFSPALVSTAYAGWVDATGTLPSGSARATFVDVDGDGDLDLIMTEPGRLYRNEGGGLFVDATSAPLDDPLDNGIACGDIDNDGDIDLYVGKYQLANRLFRNEGGGGFVDATTGPLADTGDGAVVAFADVDNDGDLDVYLSRWDYNQLYRNDGGWTFVDITSGPLVGFFTTGDVIFGDIENDGDLDLYVDGVKSGMVSSGLNTMLRNDGGGTFTDVTDSLLAGEPELTISATVMFGDVDNDGDLDLYRDARLLRNDGVASGHHWLEVRPVGTISNRSAIGARVRVVAGGVSQIREISGFQPQNTLIAAFGLALATVVDTIEIRWPSGIVQDTSNVAADQILTMVERDVMIDVARDDSTPLVFRLDRGVPNPFTRSTMIRFDLPQTTQVSVQIYDVRGRRVRTLAAFGVLPAGRHEVEWKGLTAEGRPAPPGIYFCVLETDRFRAVRRLALLR